METHKDVGTGFYEAMRLMAENRFEESITELNRIVETDGDHRMARLARGSAFLRLADASNAIADFDHLIDLNPSDCRAHHLRALSREALGDDSGALADLDRALRLDPEYGAAYHSRSNLHLKMGRQDLAMEDIEALTALTRVNLERFGNRNNVWHTHHMRLEEATETELAR